MEKVAALPTQIILFIDNLTRELHLAKSAETFDAAREKVSAAIELAEQINKVACDAAAEIGASIPMSHDGWGESHAGKGPVGFISITLSSESICRL
jgi:hypothetical protein